MWLGHQLSVASGLRRRLFTVALCETSRCFRSSQQVRVRRRVRSTLDAECTVPEHGAGPRSVFRQLTCKAPAGRAGGFTYSDLLATCAPEVFARGTSDTPRTAAAGRTLVADEYPESIVRRLRQRHEPNSSVRALSIDCLAGRKNTRSAAADLVDDRVWRMGRSRTSLLTRLPGWITGPALRRYLNRPSIDMATGVFSQSIAGAARRVQNVERIECVGLLHPRQSVAINGATHQGKTWLTFTYDTGLLRTTDEEELIRLFEQQIVTRARRIVMTGLKRRASIRYRVDHPVPRHCARHPPKLRILRFATNQRRLRRKYRIHSDTPVLSYGPRVVEAIRQRRARRP